MIKNKKKNTEVSIALGYGNDDLAPYVSAIGKNKISKEMERLARRYGIPIAHDNQLLARLKELDVDQNIPEETFLEVAKLFAANFKK